MAGAGYKLFNTGDVLTAAQVNTYLMEQTTMVFADAAARTAALSGVVAEGMISYLKSTKQVEVYNGSAWVASDDPNAIQNTIVDAKGDLITATANDTPARLAVGNNGESLVADSSATTGLRWQSNYAAGKNKIINGDFQIWQRGTSFTVNNATAYTADRFLADNVGNATVSQQTFTPGTAPVAGYEGQYFLRFNQTSGGAAFLIQRIEDVRQFAGQTITVSLWAKAASSLSLAGQVRQNFGSGGSANVNTTLSTQTVGTSWARYSWTVAVPSITGATVGTSSYLQIRFDLPSSGTFTFDIWGVQVEAGNTATAFQTATGTLQGELAACQRYYWRSKASAAYSRLTNSGFGQSATAISVPLVNPVEMRVAASSLDYGGTVATYDGTNITNCTAVTIDTSSSPKVSVIAGTVASGLTQYRAYGFIANNDASSYIGLSAEL